MRSPVEGARRLARVGGLVLRASRTYGRPPHAVLRRALDLHYRRGYAMEEAQALGVLDPGLPDARIADFASRSELRQLQRRLNPSSLAALTEDKAVFHRVCALAGIPAPTVYAVLDRSGGGWTLDRSFPQTRPEWAEALARTVPEEFVAKPTDGHFGIGVRFLHRVGEGFAEGDRLLAGAEDLYDSLLSDRRHATVLLQERLHNHPLLAACSGSATLQTIRMMTLLDAPGDVILLGALLKIVTGDAAVDNFHDGATGNGCAVVDLASGELGQLVVPRPDKLGYLELDRHPKTGERVVGLRLPHWDAALDLVRRSSRLFEPIGTVGWDVALTPGGPVLVEGNMWWGPPNELGLMPTIIRALSATTAGAARPLLERAAVSLSL